MKSMYLYFTLGYPDFGTLSRFISAIDPAKVSGIELGFPSKDPHYDGPVIRRTHSAALSADPSGSNEIIELLDEKRIPKYSLSYFSDIGDRFDTFLSFLSEHNFSGCIIPDTFVDFFDDYRDIIGSCQDSGISFIPFFNAATPDRVIEDVCSRTDSWIYFGIQPSTGINVPFDIAEASVRMRNLIGERELVYGFGIRNNEHIREIIRSGGDGIAVGSMFVPMLESGNSAEFIQSIDGMREVLNDNA